MLGKTITKVPWDDVKAKEQPGSWVVWWTVRSLPVVR